MSQNQNHLYPPPTNSGIHPRGSHKSRREFLTASAGLIASAFLPAAILNGSSLSSPALARTAKSNLLPEIPRYGSNPYAQAAIEQLTALLKEEKTKPFPGFSRRTSAFDVGAVAEETLELIRAYNYEQSSLKGDGDCLKAIIARCDCIFAYAKAVRSDDEYGYVAPVSEIVLLLTELMPTSVDSTRLQEWKDVLETVMQGLIAKYTERLTVGPPGKTLASADVRVMAATIYSGIVLSTPKYKNLYTSGLQLMEKMLQGDGGINYSDEQNDCFAYHSIFVTTLARLWQVTGDKAAADLISATQWYIPVSTGGRGAAEYYTAPSWKQLWDTATGADAAVVIVGLTGNAYNAGHLKHFAPPPSLFLASFYKDEVQEASLPENYLFYDQNIKGPRGRNGDYSFAGTGRTTLNSTRGKSTFVGCMVTESADKLPEENNGFLINSALAGVSMEVTTSRKVDFNRSTPPDLVYLVQRETVSTTANSKFGAVSTHHRISAYQHTASEWFVSEAWLLTPERMVGLLSIHALSDQLGCSIEGVLKFVSGCGDWGTAKKFVDLTETKESEAEEEAATANSKIHAFSYGALTARVIDHDFDHLGVSYVNTFNDQANKCGRLVMSSTSPGMRMFSLGTGHFFVCEIHPSRFQSAKSIERITDINGIMGLKLEEANGRSYQLLVNDTSGVVDLKTALKGGLPPGSTLISSGDAFRPSYLPAISTKARAAKLTSLAGLNSVMEGEAHDTKEPGHSPATKDNTSLDTKLLLKPYRHKIIFSDPGRRK